MLEVTQEAVLACIFDKHNETRKIWTPTTLIDRMGIARQRSARSDRRRLARKRAKTVLHELWLQGRLLRKIEPDTRGPGPEIAYLRPEDAPGKFLVPCRECHEPCPSFGERDLLCEACGAARRP